MHYKKVLAIGATALVASLPSLTPTLAGEKEKVEPPSTMPAPAMPTASPEPEKTIPPKAVSTPAPHKIIVRTAPIPSYDHTDLMIEAGIAESDYHFVEYIINHEGSWSPCKVNGGAIDCDYYVLKDDVWKAHNGNNRSYGICQALPGYKMASEGSDWQTSISTQLRWCTKYAKARYGSWKNAYDAWQKQHWW